MKNFKEFYDEQNIDYFIIEVPQEFIDNCTIDLIIEGVWKKSNNKDWMFRIDPENTNTTTQRHIHIARNKHINSKNNQVSWNKDGTRHDKKSFNKGMGNIKTVQNIAKQALGLSKDFILENVEEFQNHSELINETVMVGNENLFRFFIFLNK